MAYEFVPELSGVGFLSTTEMAPKARLSDMDSDKFDAAMIRYEYGQASDLSDGVMTEGRAVYGAGGSVADEVFTSSYDTWVDLDNMKIADYNYVVESTDGATQYSLGSDFELDLENGKIKVLSSGGMADNTDYNISYDYNYAQKLITGLTSGTQYYYKGYFLPIMFNSQSLMNEIAKDASVLQDLLSNYDKKSDIFNTETAITEIVNTEVGMDTLIPDFVDEFLADSKLLARLLSSQYAIEKVWNSDSVSTDIWNGGQYDGDKTFGLDLDLTNYSLLKLKTKTFSSYGAIKIFINGSNVLTVSESLHDWTERSIDISDFQNSTVELYYEGGVALDYHYKHLISGYNSTGKALGIYRIAGNQEGAFCDIKLEV
jgi:hypothetical protein